MGARTDFLRALSIGIVVGVALTTVVFQLRRGNGDNPTATPMPDRAIEREALLAKAADALARCGRGVTPRITLALDLHVDPHGKIVRVDSNAKHLGHEAATCAETALLAAAEFAAAPVPTRVPITVALGN